MPDNGLKTYIPNLSGEFFCFSNSWFPRTKNRQGDQFQSSF